MPRLEEWIADIVKNKCALIQRYPLFYKNLNDEWAPLVNNEGVELWTIFELLVMDGYYRHIVNNRGHYNPCDLIRDSIHSSSFRCANNQHNWIILDNRDADVQKDFINKQGLPHVVTVDGRMIMLLNVMNSKMKLGDDMCLYALFGYVCFNFDDKRWRSVLSCMMYIITMYGKSATGLTFVAKQDEMGHGNVGAPKDQPVFRDSLRFTLFCKQVLTHRTLKNMHILAFVSGHHTARMVSSVKDKTTLEMMYKNARGCMRRIVNGRADFVVDVDTDVTQLAKNNKKMCFLVFYELIKNPDNYEYESFGHVPLTDIITSHTSRAFYSLRGPMTTNIRYADNFEPLKVSHSDVDCVLGFSESAVDKLASSASTTQINDMQIHIDPAYALDPQRGENECIRTKFLVTVLGKMRETFATNLKMGEAYSNQPIMYPAYPLELMSTIALTMLSAPEYPFDKAVYLIKHAIQMKGLSPTGFKNLCALIADFSSNRAIERTKALVILKSVVNNGFGLFSALGYRYDAYDGEQIDNARTSRLVGAGDCEDTAETIYQFYRRFMMDFNKHRPQMLDDNDNSGVIALADLLQLHYTPGCGSMTITSDDGSTPCHVIFMLVPTEKLDITATSTASSKWPIMVIEGTSFTDSHCQRYNDMFSSPIPPPESLVKANDMWKIYSKNIKSGGYSDDVASIVDKWKCPCPMEIGDNTQEEFRDGFYVGFLSFVCRRRELPELYLISDSRGVSHNDIYGPRFEFAMKNADNVSFIPVCDEQTMREAYNAHKYIEDYGTFPVPLFPESEAEVADHATMPAYVKEIWEGIEAVCGKNAVNLKDIGADSSVNIAPSITLLYNCYSHISRGDNKTPGASLEKFFKLAKITPDKYSIKRELIEFLPQIYLVFVTIYLD